MLLKFSTQLKLDMNWLVWQICCGLCGQHSWVSYNNREASKRGSNSTLQNLTNMQTGKGKRMDDLLNTCYETHDMNTVNTCRDPIWLVVLSVDYCMSY